MKVLQINACFGFLSTGLIVDDIDRIITQNGYESYVAYQKSVKSIKNGYKIGTFTDRKLHAVHTRVFGKQGYASKHQTVKFLKWVDMVQPDIVHLHNLHSNYLNFNMLFDYLAEHNIKTVYTFHDCWAFTGKCHHYVSAGCNKWKSSCGNCPQNIHSLFVDATRQVLKDRTGHMNAVKDLTVVACSNWMQRQVEESLLKPKRLLTIYNGVNTDIFKPHDTSFRKEHDMNDKFLILAFANKWGDKKNRAGVQFIIENLQDDEYLILIGCNKDQMNYFSSFDKVKTFGYIKDRHELSDIYADCNVFVNLTYEDTLPTVNMESLCCGTPVITFNSCGSPELVSDTTGMIVEQGDFAGILESIRIIKNNDMQIDFGGVNDRFDRDNCYQKYLDLYRTIIEEAT